MRTVFLSGRRPRERAVWSDALVLSDACQKFSRTGRPYCRIWAGRRPQPSAISRTASEGTKHASTALWNHVGCAEPRSVTTVANGIGRSRQRLMSARI